MKLGKNGLQELDVFRKINRQEVNGILVAFASKVSFHVEDVRDASRHSRGKVPSGGTENDNLAAGHVLASVITNAFHDGRGAGVPDAETLGDNASDVRRSGGRSVQNDVAYNDGDVQFPGFNIRVKAIRLLS